MSDWELEHLPTGPQVSSCINNIQPTLFAIMRQSAWIVDIKPIKKNETECLASLEDLWRKLPVTQTLLPRHNTMQFSLTRDTTKELGIGK
nr:f-actin-capping protein subunit alpha [Quercus suber]